MRQLIVTATLFGLGSAFPILILPPPLSAQMADLFGGNDDSKPVEEVEEGGTPDDEGIPGWKDLDEETWGPAARVEEYLPHKACAMCFTLPNYSPYTINEYVESDVEDGAIIIMREIPNPAPEITARDDYDPEIGGYYDPETGERVWFIGRQAITGPTDEEKWSPDLPVSTIEMKRIKARHLDRIFSIEGVNSFGIGTHGFVVGVSPHVPENKALVPDELEGVPVTVETRGLSVLNGADSPSRSGDDRGVGVPLGHTVLSLGE